MLAAGLDANAMRWSGVVPKGSLGWALLALADGRGGEANSGALSSFAGADKSDSSRKTAFLVAGLAGLGRISDRPGATMRASSRSITTATAAGATPSIRLPR
jgi:hypothetical protein